MRRRHAYFEFTRQRKRDQDTARYTGKRGRALLFAIHNNDLLIYL
jgi:hypothetical protein